MQEARRHKFLREQTNGIERIKMDFSKMETPALIEFAMKRGYNPRGLGREEIEAMLQDVEDMPIIPQAEKSVEILKLSERISNLEKDVEAIKEFMATYASEETKKQEARKRAEHARQAKQDKKGDKE